MQDNKENLPYFYLEYQDPRNGNLFTETHPMTPEDMEKMKELDKLTEEYNAEFNTLFDSLCPQFDERLNAIGGWIATNYNNILPTKKEFIEWFIRTKIGTLEMIPHYSKNDNDEYSQKQIEYIDFWVPNYKNTFIPNLIDDYLMEYCQEYKNNLELKRKKIFQQLSTPDHAEDGKKGKSYPFTALQIAIAVTMVNEKTEKFPKEVSKTNGEIKRKFIEDIEKEFKFENVPERFFREYASLQLSKEYLQNLDETNKKQVKKILELGRYTKLLKDIKLQISVSKLLTPY